MSQHWHTKMFPDTLYYCFNAFKWHNFGNKRRHSGCSMYLICSLNATTQFYRFISRRRNWGKYRCGWGWESYTPRGTFDGWTGAPWRATLTGPQVNPTTVMVASCALRCWYLENPGWTGGMMLTATLRVTSQSPFARNPCERAIKGNACYNILIV